MAEDESSSQSSDGDFCGTGASDNCVNGGRPRYSRANTLEEKRKMRSRRKQKRKKERAQQRKKTEELAAQTTKYKCMARSFWDRWQWELMKRREAMQEQLKLRTYCKYKSFCPKVSPTIHVHQIDLDQLLDPVKDEKPQEVYLGRGSFSVVRLQLYRGIKVAVKEFLPRTFYADVKNEASMLARFCHPYLPFVFGLNITSRPYRIVMQFHGFGAETVTLQRELLSRHHIKTSKLWLRVCSEIVEALSYLHDEVSVLHNDIKLNNIIISEGEQISMALSAPSQPHIVLIDFGKATEISSGRRYNLSEVEKVEYLVRYPHIAPEVVHGESRQSVKSDMYAVGVMFLQLADNNCFSRLPSASKTVLNTLILNCKSLMICKRPTARDALKTMKTMLI